ncbi:transcriptional regulator [Aeromicrobium sp. Root344]|uniref:transcriptional regulator n=1 Tax=Aeromicrobium sp. Root344 TaxID=1736521 RepID=UPI00191010E5|nr:transcriptional regulator [Aeromicrobium sp. Root344]
MARFERKALNYESRPMTDHPIHELDDDVHQRVRLGILASLLGLSRADFALLKRELALTDGNLGRHLAVLQEAGLVKLTREARGGRPRTWVAITAQGKKALRKEINALREIMARIESAESAVSIEIK